MDLDAPIIMLSRDSLSGWMGQHVGHESISEDQRGYMSWIKSSDHHEHYQLLLHLDTLELFHCVRPRMKRAQDGLLPMLFLPRL